MIKISALCRIDELDKIEDYEEKKKEFLFIKMGISIHKNYSKEFLSIDTNINQFIVFNLR